VGVSDTDLLFELVATLTSPTSGAKLLAAAATFDHHAVSLWKAGPRHIVSFGDSGKSAVLLDDLRVHFPMIDVLPGERILICDARTKGSTPNAWVFSNDGSLQARSAQVRHISRTPRRSYCSTGWAVTSAPYRRVSSASQNGQTFPDTALGLTCMRLAEPVARLQLKPCSLSQPARSRSHAAAVVESSAGMACP